MALSVLIIMSADTAERVFALKIPNGTSHLMAGVDRNILRCPYHQWSYGLDGTLRNAPFLKNVENFDKSEFSLKPVGVGLWGGFIFLKLEPGADDVPSRLLTEDVGQAATRLGNYPLNDLRTAVTLTYDIEANWKVIAENYNECYHCGGVHPELCEIAPALKMGGGLDLDWEKGVPHREGAWTFTTTGTSNRQPFATLTEDEKIHHKGEIVYPNMLLSMSAEHGAAFLLWPLSANKTRLECRFLFHPDEMAKQDFDPSDAVDIWDITNRQDWAVCERVQAGMNSRSFDTGYFAPMEDESADIRRYLARFFPEGLKS